jgi:hypothetical protein
MPIQMTFDPVRVVIEACESLYPHIDCELEWVSDLHEQHSAFGVTEFDETPARVSIDVNTPMIHVIEILAHELAHVVAGFDAGHGPEWERAFAAIHAEHSRRVDLHNASLENKA